MNTNGTTRTKAAKDDDLEAVQMAELVTALKALAKEWEQCADRAETIVNEETRRRAASQVRFVAVLAASGPGMAELGRSWAIAGRRMLDAANRADLNPGPDSRARRRLHSGTTETRGIL